MVVAKIAITNPHGKTPNSIWCLGGIGGIGISRMKDEDGIEAIVLGCTELPLLLNDEK